MSYVINQHGKLFTSYVKTLVRSLPAMSSLGNASVFKTESRCLSSQSPGETQRRVIEGALKRNQSDRFNLAVCAHLLQDWKFTISIDNHISFKSYSKPDREGKSRDILLLIPYGLHWSEVTAKSLIGVDLETGKEVVEEAEVELPAGVHEPDITASVIHSGIQKSRPQDNVVLHLHPPGIMTLVTLKDLPNMLPKVTQETSLFHNDVAFDTAYQTTMRTDLKEGERLAKVLGPNKSVLMMGNHGVTVVAKTCQRAIYLLYFLEDCANIIGRSLATGQPLQEIELIEVESLKAGNDAPYYYDRFYNTFKRLILNKNPFIGVESAN